MTIKQIAEKYGVSYNIAYQATYGVMPTNSVIRDKDFPEVPVVDNIKVILLERIKRNLEKSRELNYMLKRVCERAE